jgi:hypothetical protein
MAVNASQLAVSTTPAAVHDPAGDGDGQSVAILTCDVDLYLGPTNAVSSSTGAKLPAGTPLGVDLAPGERLFAVTASGSGTAHVLRTGV